VLLAAIIASFAFKKLPTHSHSAKIKYPDKADPDGPLGAESAGTYGSIRDEFNSNPGKFLANSHYGKLQYLHSMSRGGADAATLATRIKGELLSGFDAATKAIQGRDYTEAGFLLGAMLHTIQDSYSRSHVVREVGGDERIMHFQDYSAQSPTSHATADAPSYKLPSKPTDADIIRSVAGADRALVASKSTISNLLNNDRKQMENLLNTIYATTPDASAKGTDDRYKK
jgi:hypothetical protein